MPLSQTVKNYRDGTIQLDDGTTPTPLTLTVAFESGDFSIDNITQGASYDVNAYLDRGEFGSLRRTSKTFPSFTFSAYFTDLADASYATLYSMITKTGYASSATSTLGASADVYTLKVTFTIEGSNFGASETDHVLVLNDCRLTLAIAEGDPTSYSISGTVYGTISAT